MDKLKIILRLAAATAAGFVPEPLKPVANLVHHGLDEIFAQIDAERQRQGLTWQELEAQLGSEMIEEKIKWAALINRLEAGDQ